MAITTATSLKAKTKNAEQHKKYEKLAVVGGGGHLVPPWYAVRGNEIVWTLVDRLWANEQCNREEKQREKTDPNAEANGAPSGRVAGDNKNSASTRAEN